MGSIPGMPHFSFLSLASVAGGIAYYIHYRKTHVPTEAAVAGDTPRATSGELVPVGPASSGGGNVEPGAEISWDDVMPVDIIGLEVGYRLIPLVDQNQGG